MQRGRALPTPLSQQVGSEPRALIPLAGMSLDPRGDQPFSVHSQPLISRNYKGDVAMSEIEHFMPLLMQREEEGALAPLLSHGRVHFLWIKYSNLYCIQPQVGPWGLGVVAAQAQKRWVSTGDTQPIVAQAGG